MDTNSKLIVSDSEICHVKIRDDVSDFGKGRTFPTFLLILSDSQKDQMMIMNAFFMNKKPLHPAGTSSKFSGSIAENTADKQL